MNPIKPYPTQLKKKITVNRKLLPYTLPPRGSSLPILFPAPPPLLHHFPPHAPPLILFFRKQQLQVLWHMVQEDPRHTRVDSKLEQPTHK